jgi:hypothetical protein
MAIGILILIVAIFLIVNTINGTLPTWIAQKTGLISNSSSSQDTSIHQATPMNPVSTAPVQAAGNSIQQSAYTITQNLYKLHG